MSRWTRCSRDSRRRVLRITIGCHARACRGLLLLDSMKKDVDGRDNPRRRVIGGSPGHDGKDGRAPLARGAEVGAGGAAGATSPIGRGRPCEAWAGEGLRSIDRGAPPHPAPAAPTSPRWREVGASGAGRDQPLLQQLLKQLLLTPPRARAPAMRPAASPAAAARRLPPPAPWSGAGTSAPASRAARGDAPPCPPCRGP
jgi:hypothetical protein